MIEVEELKELPQLTREIAVEMRLIPRTKRAEDPAVDPENPAQGTEEDEADEDRFEISISSEAEVPRWFGTEILDHSTNSVDLSRAAGGLAHLVDHDTGDQVGIVQDVALGADRKLRGIVRFSRSARAQDIKRDVQDGIRPFISVGYRVNEVVLEKQSDDEGNTYRVTNWTPAEVSTVAIPADTTVGVGRSDDAKTYPVKVRSLITKSAPKPQTTITTGGNMEPKQVAEIVRLGSVHKMEPEVVAGMIERGLTLDQASAEILKEVGKRANATTPIEQPAAEVVLTEKEQREYRLQRGVMQIVANEENGKRENCFELEVSEQVEKTMPSNVKRHGGLFVPYKIGIDQHLAAKAERAIRSGMDSKTVGSGKELVFIEPGSFIEFLYNRMLVKQFGCQVISGLQSNIAFPKQTGRSIGSWVAENPGVDVAETAPTLGQITMSPQTHQSTSSYSRQLLTQGVVDVRHDDPERSREGLGSFDRRCRPHRRRDWKLSDGHHAHDWSPAVHARRGHRERHSSCVGRRDLHAGDGRGRQRGRARRLRMGHDSWNQISLEAHPSLGEHDRPPRMDGRRHDRRHPGGLDQPTAEDSHEGNGNQPLAAHLRMFRTDDRRIVGERIRARRRSLPLEEAGNDRAHDLRDGRRGHPTGSRVRRRFLLQTRLSRSAPNLARGSGSSRVFDRSRQMLEEVKQISNLDPVKTARIRILRAVVLAPHTVGQPGDVYDVPRWMANELVGVGQAERVLADNGQ